MLYTGGYPGDVGMLACVKNFQINNQRFEVQNLPPENLQNVRLGSCELVNRYVESELCLFNVNGLEKQCELTWSILNVNIVSPTNVNMWQINGNLELTIIVNIRQVLTGGNHCEHAAIQPDHGWRTMWIWRTIDRRKENKQCDQRAQSIWTCNTISLNRHQCQCEHREVRSVLSWHTLIVITNTIIIYTQSVLRWSTIDPKIKHNWFKNRAQLI